MFALVANFKSTEDEIKQGKSSRISPLVTIVHINRVLLTGAKWIMLRSILFD